MTLSTSGTELGDYDCTIQSSAWFLSMFCVMSMISPSDIVASSSGVDP